MDGEGETNFPNRNDQVIGPAIALGILNCRNTRRAPCAIRFLAHSVTFLRRLHSIDITATFCTWQQDFVLKLINTWLHHFFSRNKDNAGRERQKEKIFSRYRCVYKNNSYAISTSMFSPNICNWRVFDIK